MMKFLSTAIMTSALVFMLACNQEPASDTLATVSGKKISQAEFDAYLKYKRLPSKDKKRRAKLLDQYLEREALADVIENEGLLDKERIKVELNEFRKEMLISRYFEAFLEEKVKDQDIENYYNTHASDFENRKVHVAHILIRTNPKMGELERKAKLTAAQEAYSKVREGKAFAQIANTYSEDKLTAKKGGDLGWIKEGSIDSRFSMRVFSMSAGDLAEPFETSFGFHVVQVIEGPLTVKQPLNSVKGNIRYRLREQVKRTEMDRLLGQLKIDKNE